LNYFRTFSFNEFFKFELKNIQDNLLSLLSKNENFIDNGGSINTLRNSNEILTENLSHTKRFNCQEIQNSILNLVNVKDKTMTEIIYYDNLINKLKNCYNKI
jgi:hypothetical protein